jgi:hypothetical protein
MDEQQTAYDELYSYAMTRGRDSFILQHVVDARAAQNADTNAKPIGVVFALVGLYLHVERRFSGRQVQDVHMRLGRRKQRWPAVTLPRDRGRLTPTDVLAAPAGTERDAAIDAWCASVWNAYADANRSTIETLLRQANVLA